MELSAWIKIESDYTVKYEQHVGVNKPYYTCKFINDMLFFSNICNEMLPLLSKENDPDSLEQVLAVTLKSSQVK